MALDWCILGPDGAPEVQVAMSPDAHRVLLARGRHLPLLGRAADYYGDAEYAPGEVGGLLDELASVGPLAGAEAELAALCQEAMRRRCGIGVVAD
jgi:hypothetical protein